MKSGKVGLVITQHENFCLSRFTFYCYEVQGCGLRVAGPVKFAPLVFSKEFNPDETIKKVSLGKRAKVAGYGLRVAGYELRVAG